LFERVYALGRSGGGGRVFSLLSTVLSAFAFFAPFFLGLISLSFPA
jgi:poly(3-hydroxybutyrate) depolymerase